MAVTDWFGRNKNRNYISEHGNHKLQWDFGMENSYSSFFAPNLDKQRLIKDSYKHACDIRDIMEVPKSIKVSLFAQPSSYSTSKKVVISTNVFDDSTLNNNQKLDIFLGLAVHEFSHILYTNLNSVKNYKSDDYIGQLTNTIEDERIESKAAYFYPGYANFLKEVKYYYFKKCFKEEHLNDVTDVLQTVFYIIRYPENVSEDIYNRHIVLFEKIKNVMSSLGKSFVESNSKAKKIWKLICDYFELPPEPPTNNKEYSQEGEPDEGDNNDNSDMSQGNESSDNRSGKSESNSTSEGSNSEGSNSATSKPAETGTVKPRSEEELKDFANSIARRISKVTSSYTTQRSSEIRTSWDAEEYSGDLVRESNDLVLHRQENNQENYNEVKTQLGVSITPLVNAFNKFFVEQKYNLSGLRRGKLDTGKLAEAYQNVETVYTQTFERITPGLDLCLLIDESGSMDRSKIDTAQQAAILLNEVCLKLPKCNLFIYGHTADIVSSGDTFINVYRDSWNKNKYSLGSVRAMCNNRDHEAIEEVYKLVRKQTNNPLLMFVISDGYPAARGLPDLSESIKLVKKTVDCIESRGDTVICQIAIESDIDPQKMFNNYIHLTDLDTFPRDLSNYVLKTLISKLKRIDI